MRTAFIETLSALAEEDERVLLLTGDLGFMVVEPFADRFPDRFFNVGVAEQNMIGLATGLAASGYVPYAYSIVTFASLRPYEFIRNGPVLHQLPVRVVGVGGGFEYGHAGPTHHGLEDIAVMRALPGMTVVAPGDPQQARSVLRATHDLPGPVYLRLGKDDRVSVQGLDGRFALGEAQVVREGSDLAFVTMGPIAVEAVAASDELAEHGVSAGVIVVASLSPPPSDHLEVLLSRYPFVVTVEAHSIAGALGSLVAEVVSERGLGVRVVRTGVRAPYALGGSAEYLHGIHGISAASLVATAQQIFTSSAT